MSQRIFRSILMTAVLALILSSVLLAGTLYGAYEARVTEELRTEAEYIVRALNRLQDEPAYLAELRTGSRITLIAPDGAVIYDSAANEAGMDSHAGRPEVLEAAATGTGESTRYSDTLSEVTLYHARRTERGNILRMASTRSSVLGMFEQIAPEIVTMLFAVAALSLAIARRAAKKIVQPINGLNLDKPLENEVYDELAPLLTRMDNQHKQIQRHIGELARAHADLNAIMQNMREGLVLLNRENCILSMNESAAKLLGFRGNAVSGADFLSLCRDASVMEILKAAGKGGSGDTVLMRGERVCHIFTSPVLRNGKVRGVVLLAMDVSAQYEAEASRREFTANVSHELKTPLTSISGYAEIMESGIARAEDVPVFAGKIRMEAKRLVALVNDILELSRLDEKRMPEAKEPAALLPMLSELTESFQPIAKEKGVELSLEGCDMTVEGYPALLRELFHNLLDNAVKYTPKGGSVKIRLEKKDGAAVCTISDTGIGIPKEHLPHIFERFYRVDKSHSRQTGGTGLGLAIVKHAAQVHHAQVQLESEYGQGTVVTVRFGR